jgi:hypothetical protein
VRLERLGKLKISNDLIGIGTRKFTGSKILLIDFKNFHSSYVLRNAIV